MNRLAMAALLLLATSTTACNGRVNEEAPPLPVDTPHRPGGIEPGGEPPDADLLLPELDGYRTDDSAEAGELAASLDHGEIRYEEIRRRLILDGEGFAQGEVTVVTFSAASGGGQAYLDHRYGSAPRSPERIGDMDMLRIATDPYPALAWVAQTFVVTFERGASQSLEWLRELAGMTVEQIDMRGVSNGEPGD